MDETSDWRDGLPPIPAERIRLAVIREGARRLEHRRRLQRSRAICPVHRRRRTLVSGRVDRDRRRWRRRRG